jgi:hypothetical protein
MNSKLLILLGAALAGLLLLGMVLDLGREIDKPSSWLLEAGHFVLKMDGVPVLEERYTLEFYPEEGYLLSALGEIAVDGEVVLMAQQTQYDLSFVPTSHHLVADRPSGPQLVSGRMEAHGFQLQVQSDGSVQQEIVPETEHVALLEDNLIAPYAALLRAVRAELLDRRFTAIIPQSLRSLPARVEGPNTVIFYSDGEAHRGKQFELHLGDALIMLIEQEGQLVGLIQSSKGMLGYDLAAYPSGIRLEEEDTPSALQLNERSSP